MNSTGAKRRRLSRGPVVASMAIALALSVAPQVAAADQLTHPSGALLDHVPASQLQQHCVLIASFADDAYPENFQGVALADGWTGVLKTFNDADTRFMALCLGNKEHRAHVWFESPVENGRFVASGPQYPPNWYIGEDGTLCMGSAEDEDAGCMDVYRHGDSGFVYLSFVEPDEAAEDIAAEGAAAEEVAAEGADDDVGGALWIVVQEDDDTPIYAGIAEALDAVAAEK